MVAGRCVWWRSPRALSSGSVSATVAFYPSRGGGVSWGSTDSVDEPLKRGNVALAMERLPEPARWVPYYRRRHGSNSWYGLNLDILVAVETAEQRIRITDSYIEKEEIYPQGRISKERRFRLQRSNSDPQREFAKVVTTFQLKFHAQRELQLQFQDQGVRAKHNYSLDATNVLAGLVATRYASVISSGPVTVTSMSLIRPS